MWRATVRGIRARMLRVALTVVAVALGVAFVVGTLVLSDGIDGAYQQVLAEAAGGSDLVVRPAAGAQGVPPGLVDEVEGVDGVEAADAVVLGVAQLVAGDGTPVGQPVIGGGTPMLGASAPAREGLRGLRLREGRFPSAPGEVAVDAAVAAEQGFAVGDRVGVVLDGPLEHFELVGIVGFAGADAMPGATLTLFDPDTARDRLGRDGRADRIDVLAADGAATGALARRLQERVGGGYEVVTAAEIAEEEFEALADGLAFVPAVLLVFAAVALFVGSFTIFNTFSILVAQRTREVGLLRAVGASRRQVFAAVLAEAGLVGAAGGLAGLAGGLGVAAGLRGLLAAFGLDMPGGGLRLGPVAAVAGLLLGLLVTAVAALVPALRATRVPPVAALSEAALEPPPPRFGRRAAAGGALLLLGGVAVVAGLAGGAGATAVAAGALAGLLGCTLLTAVVVGPLARLVGVPVAWLAGIRGELAGQNARRSPRRTAATASALMIGLGLVAVMAVVTHSLRASFDRVLDEVFLVDFRVESTTLAGDPEVSGISRQIAPRLEALDAVAVASPERIAFFAYEGGQDAVLALDAASVDDIYAFPVVDGELTALASGGVAVSDRVAEARGWTVGSRVVMEHDGGAGSTLPVVAVIEADLVDVNFLVDNRTFEELFPRDHDNRVAVVLAGGADREEARALLEEVVAAYPTARLLDAGGLRDELVGAVNQLLGLVAALLLLSVLVALLGIVNTLALSILERVRELGLLRAVGATRPQVAAMVRLEAMVVSLLGGLLGVGVGVPLAWLVVRALGEFGVTEFALPLGWLAGGLAVAAVAGVVAGVLPARRAARVEILQAIRSL